MPEIEVEHDVAEPLPIFLDLAGNVFEGAVGVVADGQAELFAKAVDAGLVRYAGGAAADLGRVPGDDAHEEENDDRDDHDSKRDDQEPPKDVVAHALPPNPGECCWGGSRESLP